MVVIAERFRAALGALALLLACGGTPDAVPEIEPTTREPLPPTTVAEPPPTRADRAAYVHSAQRCGECHEPAFTTWEGSPHAHSADAPAFVRMRSRVADRSSECVPCHAPLTPWVPTGDAIATEGVACDACHAAAELSDGGVPGLDLRLDDNVKYGPLSDAHDHYFHRMGYSPLHTTARFCSACHDLVRTVDGAAIPVYSEFSEWSAGPYAEEGTDCQFCHMPISHGVVATGSPERDAVSHHGFFGASGDLRTRALVMQARATGAADVVNITVSLENRRAGHRVPSGMPGRRIVVRARVVAADGSEIARSEFTLARILVDATGHEAPHHEAVRLLSDERIGPRETRVVPLTLVAPAPGELVIEILWREMSDELARVVGIDSPREQRLAEARMTLGPPAARRRIGRARAIAIPLPTEEPTQEPAP
jgi:hypothetical protein